MNLRDLQYFLAVAELGHFGRAAERCHVSQPTLSGQIRRLELHLGVKLFERTNRRVMITEAGEQILGPARRIQEEVDRILDLARGSQNPLAGRFRLGAFPTLADYVFPELVQEVLEVLPDLRLVLFEEKAEALLWRLHAGTLDAALVALPIQDAFLRSAPLFVDELCLAVPRAHALARRKAVRQEELRGHRLLLLEEGHCLRDQALEVCRLHGLSEEQDFMATGLETLRQMVKAGTGITLMPRIALREDDPGISYIPFASPAPSREIGIVWRHTSARGAVIDRLIECLRPERAPPSSRRPPRKRRS